MIIAHKKGKFYTRITALNNFQTGVKKMTTDYFNRKKMLPTKLYFNYLESLIGNYNFCDKEYLKLQRKIFK